MPLQPLPVRDITAEDLKDPNLSYINSLLKAHADAINNLSGANGPIKLGNHLDLNGNRIINVGAARQPTDVLTTTAANPIYGQAAQQASMEAVGTKMLQTTRRLNDGSQQHKTSGDLKGQGSIPPTVLGQTTYTSTGTDLTISFPLTVQYGDQSVISIPRNTVVITGLVNGVTYKIYPYYDTRLGLGQVVVDSVNALGTPPGAFPNAASAAILQNAAQLQNADGRVPLANGAVSMTPSGGGSGGGGGSNCLWSGMVVETRTRGIIPLKFVQDREIIRRRFGKWTMVVRRQFGIARAFICIRLSNGEEMRVSPSDPIALFDGHQIPASDLSLASLMIGCNREFDDMPLQIMNLSPWQQQGETVLLTVDDENHDFLTGVIHPCVVAHNFVPNK